MRLSIVVPCYNEEDVIALLHDSLQSEVVPHVAECEFVFVDDGSTDSTLRILRKLADEDDRVRYVSFSRNFGKEAAMLAGLRAATGQAIVIMDADLQHPPKMILAMLDAFTDEVDQVVARRTRAGDPLLRTGLARLYYRLMNRMVDVPLGDGQGDFRLLSRRAADSLLAMPEANRFSKGLFGWIGYKHVVLDYDSVPRVGGVSRWSIGRLLNYGLDGVLSFNSKPLRASIWIGLVVVLASFLYLVWLVANALVFGIEVPGYITTVAVVTTLSGIQLVFLGVIGEYIGRLYMESKRRPHYIVRDDNLGKAGKDLGE